VNIETRTRIDKSTGREVKSYVARVYHPGIGKSQSKTFARKADAALWGAETERKVRLGDPTDRPEDITVGDLAKRYLASMKLERTRRKRKNGVDKWVKCLGKNTIASHVKRSDVKGFAESLNAGDYAPGTIGTYVATLKAALALALEDGFVRTNVAAGRIAGAPRGKRTRVVRALTHTEHESLLAALPARWRPLFYVWPRCGLRIGEMRALKWEHVDLANRCINVVEQYQYRDGFCPPKCGSEGTVYLSLEAVQALREWKLASGAMRNPHGLVFPADKGGVFDDDYMTRKVLKPAAIDAGLDWVVPHTMRHTFGSWLLDGGVTNLTFIQKQMRHASLKQTVECYLHDASEDPEELANAVEGRGAVHSPFTQSATGTGD
jgi:integrase